MAKMPKGLEEAADAGVALNPLVGLAKEDLIGAVGVMLKATATQPGKVIEHSKSFADDVIKIITMSDGRWCLRLKQ